MKTIIAGGRDFSDIELLTQEIDRLPYTPSEVVCGKARGADACGEMYAKINGLTITEFPAEWEKYGKRAGYIRNSIMAKYADALIAFWDGESKGTKHMIDLAREECLFVTVIDYINLERR